MVAQIGAIRIGGVGGKIVEVATVERIVFVLVAGDIISTGGVDRTVEWIVLVI